MSPSPTIAVQRDAGIERVSLSGHWGAAEGELVETAAAELEAGIRSTDVELDLSDLSHLDTLGAWVINRVIHRLESRQIRIRFHGVREAHQILLKETIYRVFEDGRQIGRAHV